MTTFGAKDFLRAQERAWFLAAFPLFEDKLKGLKKGQACQLTIANTTPFERPDGSVCGCGTWNRVQMIVSTFRDLGWHVETSDVPSSGMYFLTFTIRPTAWEHIDDPSV